MLKILPIYNLIEYCDNYSKTSGGLWQYCKDIPAINDNGEIVNFNGANATDSFNFKVKVTGQTGNDKTKNVKIMVPFQYLIKFWRTVEMPLIKCEVNLILTWSENCVVVYADNANQNPRFEITETTLYVPVVTLSTQDNANSLQQLKSGFKMVLIGINIYQNQNKPRFNAVYSRNNLPNKIKDGTYVISLDEHSDIRTH